jgi:hypothetical protein
MQSVKMAEDLTNLWGNLSLVEEEEDELEIMAPAMDSLTRRGELCLVGKLITDRLVSKETVRTKLIRGWRPLGNLSFKVLGENLFLLEFEYECDRIRVLEGRPWVFERSVLFAVEAFDGITPPAEMVFEKVAFWVRIYGLPLACMGQEVGRQVGAPIGEVEMVDTDEEGAAWGEFLRVRIKVDLTKPLLRGRRLKIKGKSIWVRFQYEQLPRFCFACGVIKHGKGGCLKRTMSLVKTGEPEYGPWLRVPSPTRRFGNVNSSWKGRSSPNRNDLRYGSDRRQASEANSGGAAGSSQGEEQTQSGAGDGAWSKSPVNSGMIIDRDATARDSDDHGNYNKTWDTIKEKESMECIYESGRAAAGSLTLIKEDILSNAQREEGNRERTSLRKDGDTNFVGCNKYDRGPREQVMGTEAAGGRKSMEVFAVGNPPAGDSAPRRGNILYRNKRAIVTKENVQLRKGTKGTKGDSLEGTKDTHVDIKITGPPVGMKEAHVTTQLTEPGSIPVLSLTNTQTEVSTGEGKNKTRKLTTKWKRRARGCPSTPAQVVERDGEGKKRGATSEDGNGNQGKRSRITNTGNGVALTNVSNGSGMAVAAWQPRRPQ